MAKGHEGDSNIAKWELSFVVYAAKVLSFITNLSINTKELVLQTSFKLFLKYMTIDYSKLPKYSFCIENTKICYT